MKHLRDCLLVVVLAGVSCEFIGCEEESRTGLKPSLQNEDNNPVEPNIPDEVKTPEEQRPQEEEIVTAVELDLPPGPVADNNLCFACHVNFKKETLTTGHARANIGCARCHGGSIAHLSDEDTITPPDVMFPRAGIKAFCMDCHPADSMNTPVHKATLAEADPLKACCTDCHGEHRLSYRTRKWDKITRTLIKDQRVRRLTDDVLERR